MDINNLSINTENAFAFEQELKGFSALLHEAGKAYNESVSKYKDTELELRILESETVEQLCREAIDRKKPYPASAMAELRRTKVVMNLDYQDKFRELIECGHERDDMSSLYEAHKSRGYRLGELGELMSRMMNDNLAIYDNTTGQRIETKVSKISKELDDES